MLGYRKGAPSWRDVSGLVFRGVLFCSDQFSVILGYSLGFLVRFKLESFTEVFPVYKGYPGPGPYLTVAPMILFCWFVAMYWLGAYRRISYPALDELLRIVRAGFLGAILSMSAMFLYRDGSFSRLVFLLGGAFSAGFIYLFREFFKIAYVIQIRRRRKPRKVLVIGSGYMANKIKALLDSHGDRAILRVNLADCKDLKKTIQRSRIKEALIANPGFDHEEAVKLAAFCEEKGVQLRILPDVLEIRMGEVLIDESLGVPTIQVKPVSLHGGAFLVKRFMDVIVSSLIIGVFFFPLAFVALLIKITSQGPIFYKHQRVGFRGTPFWFLKFRTMCQNADDMLEELKKQSDRGGPVFKMKKDPRVTSVGKFLRRYSIDEIPQLLNVLLGEMSMVGPRPQVLWEAEMYNEWARKRLNVLPGITGLWQVSGRAELTFEEMIDLDIFYIEHWSSGLDIKIIFRTLPAVLMAKGAY